MKIEQIKIFGYGKWSEKTIDLTTNFNIFIGNNEAGKTTLQSFVRSILFGFPKKTKKDYNTYEPKDKSVYGGQLILFIPETNERFIIERTRIVASKKDTVKIMNEFGDELPLTKLDDILVNLSQETYDRFFALQLSQLHTLTQVEKEALNRYFLTIGSSGSDQLFQLKQTWLKESDNLYRPAGKVQQLNQQLSQLISKQEVLKNLEQEQQKYTVLLQEYEDFDNKQQNFATLELQQNETLQQLEKDYMLYDLFTEWELLKNELQQEKVISLDKDVRQRFEQLQTQLTQQSNYINQETTQLNTLEVENQETEAFSWYKKNAQEIKQGLQKLPKMEQIMQEALSIEVALTNKDEHILHEKRYLQMDDQDVVPMESMENNEEWQFFVEKMQALSTDINNEQQNYATTKKALELQIDRVAQEKVDLYKIEEAKKNVTNLEVAPFRTFMLYGLIAVAFFLSGVIAKLFEQIIVSGISFCISFFFIGLGMYFTYKQQRVQQQENKLQSDNRLRYKYLKEQLDKEEAILIDDRKTYVKHGKALKELHNEKAQLEELILKWKKENDIPVNMPLEQVTTKRLSRIWQLVSERKALAKDLDAKGIELAQFEDHLQFFAQKYPLQEFSQTQLNYMRKLVKRFKEFYDEMKLEEVREQQLLKEIERIKRSKEQNEYLLNQLLEQEHQLYQQADVTTKDDFLKVLYYMEEQQNKKERKTLLEQQLGNDIERLNSYKTKDSLEQKIITIKEKLINIHEEKQVLYTNQARVRQQIASLEKDGTYLANVQEHALLESQIHDLLVEVGGYLVAAQVVDDLLSSDKNSHLEKIIQDTSDLFKRLTNSEYQQVSFKDKRLIVKNKDNKLFNLYELSTGTLEQLYIVLRLAFIQNVSNVVNLPIIIDDCFVNFDENRKKIMYHILAEITKTHQVLYFTFNKDIVNVLNNVQKQVISLAMNE